MADKLYTAHVTMKSGAVLYGTLKGRPDSTRENMTFNLYQGLNNDGGKGFITIGHMVLSKQNIEMVIITDHIPPA